ncbi:MAG: EAL domain-containing protein [Arenicellales bacterium]|nr:EAL domain-containing protein [Arenicellales bacterium]
MKFIRSLLRPALLAYGITSLLFMLSVLESSSFFFTDWSAQILRNTVKSDVVVVQFDFKTLRELGDSEKRYTHHAELLKKLLDAGARRVFMDFDVFEYSDAMPDQNLYDSLQAIGFDRVLIPLSWSNQRDSSGQEAADSSPIAPFPEDILVSTKLVLGSDARVRQVFPLDMVGPNPVPTAVAKLSEAHEFPEAGRDIDFSIHPSSFQRLSYVDVLKGHFDASVVKNKIVIAGPTASNVAVEAPVPIYRSMPSSLVHAFAYQSIENGPTYTVPVWALMLISLLTAILLQGVFFRIGWRPGLFVMLALVPSIFILSLLAKQHLRLTIDIVPLLCVTILCFVSTMLAKLNQQSIRLWLQKGELDEKEAKITELVNHSIDAIVTFDSRGALDLINPAAENMFGYEAADFPNLKIKSLIPDLSSQVEDRMTVEERTSGATQEMEGRAKNGRTFPVDVSLSRSEVNERILYTAIIRDITERKRQEARLRYQATHDALTGLPNRSLLARRMETALAFNKSIAVLMIDLNGFKDVNDTLGHDVGDLVLRTVSKQLLTTMPKNTVVARIGGDEFAAFVPIKTEAEEVIELARKLLESLEDPLAVRGIEVQLGMSVGIAVSPDHADEPSKLLQCADLAMIQAKQSASGYQVFDSSMNKMTIRRLRIAGKLKSAIASNKLEMHYQPKVELAEGSLAGVEALVRWNDPDLGAIYPDEFIKLAETSGLVRPLTISTMDMSLAQHANWWRQGIRVSIAVNLSAHMIQDPELPQIILDSLRKYDVDPTFLTLELTESAIMSDPKRALGVANEVSMLGITLAVDDFGTGYSSLAYLKDLPVEELKIDKSFVLDLSGGSEGFHIINSIITLGHGLGLKIVAEGVEDRETFTILHEAGCDLAQGYWISQPIVGNQLRDWIKNWNPFELEQPVQLRSVE